MNSKEFLRAVDNIVKEKNIDPSIVYDAMELALTSAYKKNFKSKTNVKVLIDRDTGEIKVFSYLTVVEDEKIEDVVETVKKELYTGHIGDGKIFIAPLSNVIRVRTGEEGSDALS